MSAEPITPDEVSKDIAKSVITTALGLVATGEEIVLDSEAVRTFFRVIGADQFELDGRRWLIQKVEVAERLYSLWVVKAVKCRTIQEIEGIHEL